MTTKLDKMLAHARTNTINYPDLPNDEIRLNIKTMDYSTT